LDFVDIFSKADLVQHLEDLAKSGQVKQCVHLKVTKGFASAFYAQCDVEWSRAIPADNVVTNDMADSAPSSYDWPECPRNCPEYNASGNFVRSLTEPTTKVSIPPTDVYIHPDRIAELRRCKSGQHDLTKLVALCEELNTSHRSNQVLAVPMLARAVLDHVPPIFGCKTFSEVANNHSGGKSFREAMGHLESTTRKIADSFLHTQVRKSETLPTQTQVDFRNGLDMLLQEVVRILK